MEAENTASPKTSDETKPKETSESDTKVDNSDNVFKMPVFTGATIKKRESDKTQSSKQPHTSANIDSELSPVTSAVIEPAEKSNESLKDKNKSSKLSPAESLSHAGVPIPYKEPTWGGVPQEKYGFEVLKNGSIVDNVNLDKSFLVFGRLPSCDVTFEHPSLSRYHAIVQYCKTSDGERDRGWYLYDLDSTHGTWINKHKVPPNVYHRLKVGYMVKFGGSTRLHILQGPESDIEDESELSVTEMKQQRDKQLKEAELLRRMELAEAERKIEKLRAEEEARGCSWGIDDAMEEDTEESEENPFILTAESEALYINDPKKALNGFFEREGYDLPEYDVSEAGFGKYKCMVELPVDTPTGEPARAEAVVSGKKREAVIQCALEACRMLDRMGLLRAAKHESHKRKKKNWEDEDFYDSDEDIYLDRTGDIEKKRQQRMKKAGKIESKTETYDSLLEKHTAIATEIKEIEQKLEKAKADEAAMENDDLDALDAYMYAIKSGAMDTKTKMKLKRQLIELRQEEAKLAKLVNIAKPANLPELKKPMSQPQTAENKKPLPMIGKMRGFNALKGLKKPVIAPIPAAIVSDKEEDIVEEEEDDDEEEEETNEKNYSDTRIGSNLVNVKNDRLISTTLNSNSVDKKQTTCTVTNSKNSKVKDRTSNTSELLRKNIEKISVKGPTLPSSDVLDRLQNKTTDSEKQSISEKESLQPERKRTKTDESVKNIKKQMIKTQSKDYDSTDPDYAVWLPPKNQSGDGKTHLNAKFGY